MRLKTLVKKFSFNKLKELCKEKNWEIPTSKDVERTYSEIGHNLVWVSDELPNPEDRETHGYLYDVETCLLTMANKNQMHHCAVIKNTRKPQKIELLISHTDIKEFKELLNNVDNGKKNNHNLYQIILEIFEKSLFKQVIETTNFNQSKASEILGINRNTLKKKLIKYNLID